MAMENSKILNELEDGGDAPDSWETADLEKQIESLSLGLKEKKKNRAATQQESSQDGEIKQRDEPCPAQVAAASESVFPGVDSFLYEALQNPRERLTILRMEQEMDRFLRSQNLSYEFPRISSSFVRMIAHKVAQHYLFQTRSADFVEGEGFRVIAEKTASSRWPAVRLSDVPSVKQEATEMEKGNMKIKSRSNSLAGRGRDNQGGSNPQQRSSKTVEERKEEYEKARARIFNSEEEGRRPEENTSKAENGSHENLAGEPPAASLIVAEAAADRRSTNNPERKQKLVKKEDTSRNIAIIRDPEKEKSDPDFARNRGRFVQRYDMPYEPSQMYGYHPQPYNGPATYTAEFPALGQNAHSGVQQGMYGDQPSPHMSSSMNYPWVPGPSGHYPPPSANFCPPGVGPTYYHGHTYSQIHPSAFHPSQMPSAPTYVADYQTNHSRTINVEASQKPATRRS